ncbi:MAG: hypothetical protein R3C11_28210 [Planctomycetaceae bacterium]
MTEASSEECDAYTTPVLSENFCRRSAGHHGGNQLDAYNPKTGAQLWHVPGLVGGRTITGPTLSEDLVFATVGMRGDLKAYDL